MKTITIKNSFTFNANSQAVWDVLGEEFLDIYKWAGGVVKSEANPEVKQRFADAPSGGRICQVSGIG